MSDKLKIGLVQYSPVWENPSGSIDKINTLLKNIPDDLKVLIFPELTLTGFTSNSEKLSEDIDGISTLFYINLAKKLKIDIFGGLIEIDNDQYFNTLLHIDSTGLIKARYRKIHPFSFAGEDKHFSSSKELVITKIGEHKIGLSICYDLRHGFPRAVPAYISVCWQTVFHPPRNLLPPVRQRHKTAGCGCR